jgi:hypothetical protein
VLISSGAVAATCAIAANNRGELFRFSAQNMKFVAVQPDGLSFIYWDLHGLIVFGQYILST